MLHVVSDQVDRSTFKSRLCGLTGIQSFSKCDAFLVCGTGRLQTVGVSPETIVTDAPPDAPPVTTRQTKTYHSSKSRKLFLL